MQRQRPRSDLEALDLEAVAAGDINDGAQDVVCQVRDFDLMVGKGKQEPTIAMQNRAIYKCMEAGHGSATVQHMLPQLLKACARLSMCPAANLDALQKSVACDPGRRAIVRVGILGLHAQVKRRAVTAADYTHGLRACGQG
jgi:hypothetical protein